MVSRNRYHAYGMGWAQEGAPPTDRLYTGQRRYGPNSGMYYYNARFYGADVGRFTQADTYAPAFPQPRDLNRYAYVYNSPLKYNDPTGHFVPGAVGSVDPGTWGFKRLTDEGQKAPVVKQPAKPSQYRCYFKFDPKREPMRVISIISVRMYWETEVECEDVTCPHSLVHS